MVTCLYKKTFLKDLAKIPSPMRGSIEDLVFTDLPASTDLHADFDFKKMRGYQDFYRIRVGKYRIGCRLTATGTLILYRVKSREEIYSVFP
ncbi:type II toxin-antitoxin system RelE family toxin [Methanofollis ethanolicus]|uniref:type II toxin-antitoxin system RelE family toxin n=1 Tax=Methanofollis ethanolicus TaxID=488124 RepID=UPI000833C1E4|nr:type II toxin-antitoxin system RelE/ParE family toxin [Methanofollis ethanolicus]